MNTTPDPRVIAAIEAFQTGDFKNALALLSKALESTPKNFDALLMYGVINGISGHLPEALNAFKRASEIEPSNNFVHFNLGKVFSDLNNDAAAIHHHEIATNLAPNHAESWLNFGRSLFRLNRPQEASACFQKAIFLNSQYAEAIASLASACISLKEFEKALTLFDQAIALNPTISGAWLMKADGLHELKRFEEALEHYDQAIKLKPDYAEAWSNKGITLHELKRFEEALEHYDQAIKLKPDYAEAWSNKGITLHELKRFEEALEHYDQAIKLKPDYAEAWSNKGITLHELKRFEEALEHYDQAIKLKPDYAEAWSNKGITLHELKRFEEALEHYDQAIKLKPDYAEAWSNKGITLHELKRFEEALEHYDQAIKLKPDYAEAWSNKGLTLILLNPKLSITCFEKAIEIDSHNADFYSNIGLAYTAVKKLPEAISFLNIAILENPKLSKAWANKGTALNEQNKYTEALASFESAYSLDPKLKFLLGNIINNKLLLADWKNIVELESALLKNIDLNNAACAPFQILAITDSAKLIQINSQSWANDQFKPCSSNTLRNRHAGKIRIGYFSPDFKTHPVGILIAGVIESHDRNQFEVFGFSCEDNENNDPYRKRFKDSFDEFYEVEHLTDAEIADLTRSLEIDIAIDLGGYTKGSRTAAFCLNLAPIQVNYLGYMGTIGHDSHDYIIADKIAIPDDHKKFYCEKIAYLPNGFMPDDDKRKASTNTFKHSDFGLPDNNFIFACFNNSYKVNPAQLRIWAEILKNVPNSILWLSKSNGNFSQNIVDEFKLLGVDSSRVIFADRMQNLDDHLKRLDLCDLFLDTFPYNAHATAIDALRSGLPMLTKVGESMASRVGASLLNALGLNELISSSSEEYQSKAIHFGTHPESLKLLKLRLGDCIKNGATFNTKIYTQNLESAYKIMHNKKINNLPAEDILPD